MRRFVIPGEVQAWVADGRWGPRHLRVEEVAATLRAEDLYDVLLRGRVAASAAGGESFWCVGGRPLTLRWLRRSNRIWRGRVFLACPACDRPAARLYLVTPSAAAACRGCLGLSYQSQVRNYRDDVGLLRPLASARDFAKRETELKRQTARRAARERQARRTVMP